MLGALWDRTAQARWFSGRSRGARPAGFEMLEWVREPGKKPGIRPATLTVAYPDRSLEHYFIPLVFRKSGHKVPDELFQLKIADSRYSVGELVEDPEAAALLLDALADNVGGLEAVTGIPRGLPAHKYEGEQSNTTLFFGDQLLAKLFRRLEPGRNPDIELHEALRGSGVVAELYGTWRHDDLDLAIFQEALPDPQDGYVLACRYVRKQRSFAEHAHALGDALAKIHQALAANLPTSVITVEEIVAGCVERYEAAAAEIPELADLGNVILPVLQGAGSGEVTVQRIHGDCHLGQVLLSDGSWCYVDFEGEPLKSIRERRLPDTPWRDVAGMLRSFAYAAASSKGDHSSWLQESSEAFLDGYGANQGLDASLLAALELDKAIYETVYESRNRPAWRQVPLNFIERLAKEQ